MAFTFSRIQYSFNLTSYSALLKCQFRLKGFLVCFREVSLSSRSLSFFLPNQFLGDCDSSRVFYLDVKENCKRAVIRRLKST